MSQSCREAPHRATAEGTGASEPTRTPRARWEWPVAAVCALASLTLGYRRYRGGATNPTATDFWVTFLPAADRVRAGDSPYTAYGYVHPPLSAWIAALVARPPARALAHWAAFNTGAGLVGIALISWALSRGIHLWARFALFLFATVSLFSTHVIREEYDWGQTNLILLGFLGAALASLSARRHGWAGFFVGMAAMLKLWPAAFCAWLLGRHTPGRWRGLAAVAVVAVLTFLSTLPYGGPIGMWESTRKWLVQGVIAYSANGSGRALFTNSVDHMSPFVVSPLCQQITVITLTVLFVALLMIALAMIVDPILLLVCVVELTLLLMPISHLMYQMFALPILWYWATQVYRHPRLLRAWVPLLVALAWWVCLFFWLPAVHTDARGLAMLPSSYLRQFGSTVVNIIITVVAGAWFPCEERPRHREAVSEVAPAAS